MPSLDPAESRTLPLYRSIECVLFRFMLSALGFGLELACRFSTNFRNQVARDMTIEVGSIDGVFHHYKFTPRQVESRSGTADSTPLLSLHFASARQGMITLISPRAVGKIVHNLLEGGAVYKGNATLLLWFFCLTRFVLPFGKTGPLRTALPDAYTAPNLESAVAGYITREAPADELDPAWENAHRRRAQMVMIRGSAGESVAMW
jgi:hypothetical protein